eukprot:12509-Chlamydomonas_euryale.AAC.2
MDRTGTAPCVDSLCRQQPMRFADDVHGGGNERVDAADAIRRRHDPNAEGGDGSGWLHAAGGQQVPAVVLRCAAQQGALGA